MRRIGLVGALVCVVAVVAGCWPFGQLLGLPAPAGGSATGIRLEYRILPTRDQPVTPEIQEQTRAIIEDRVNAIGVVEPNVRTQGGDRITIELLDVVDLDELRRLAGATGRLDFVAVPNEYTNAIVEGQPLPVGIDPTPIFGGDQIAAARPGTDQMGQPTVDIELKAEGADLFDDYAAAHYGERFAIVLDGVVISAPTINATRFDGAAQISGGFTTDDVNRLVTLVKFGRLPLAVEEVSVGDPGTPPDATPAALQATPAVLQATPVANPWPIQAVIIVQLTGADGGSPTAEQAAQAESVVRTRLATLGGPGASVRSIPDDRLRIDLADEAWAEPTRRVAVAPGDLQFVPVPAEFADTVIEGEPLPAGMPVEPLFGSEGIDAATLGSDMLSQPAVDLVFTPAAATLFDDYAALHLGERFAMVLDGVVLLAPTINAPAFDGRAQISGAVDGAGIAALVAILAGGVLPVVADIVTVCPATGECPATTGGPTASPGT